ncbi:MAG TPA: 5-formyltetrahydrofolate cyclo-ligase [Mariprofundaceae bacterium]|nr:5-formyltetrahydrofolate cyclo-ligase [Mariprofundaceae bacterium]
MDDKRDIRFQALKARRALPADEHHHASIRIQNTLLAWINAMDAAHYPLLTYRAMSDEVNTDHLFTAHTGRIFAPVTHERGHMHWHEVTPDTAWQRGALDVREPRDGPTWEPATGRAILACPLVAFDRHGNRLGLGKGCFDLWLSRFRSDIFAVAGLAFACQEVPEVPVEAHDIPMDYVITEHEVITCRIS